MAHILKALVGETSASTGTGALTLAGALTDHRAFSAVCSTSDTTEVMVRHASDGSWAHCKATYSAANELTLTETVESSTGSAISWASGGLTVVLTPLARSLGVGPDNTVTLTNKTLIAPVITNYTETAYVPAANTAFTVDLANGTLQKLTTSGNCTITLPSPVAGKSYTIQVAYGGAHTLTWAGGGTIKWPAGTAPSATSVSGKVDTFTFYCVDGTNTFGASGGANA